MGKRKKNKLSQTHDIAPYESKRQKHEGNDPDTSRGRYNDEIPHCDMQTVEQIPKDHHKRRTGTASVSGHLYETKLILLLLFRATHNECINKFYLGSNLDGIGAIDDIVFKYYINGEEKPRFLFIQCYHRENPTKEQVKDKDVMKIDGHFSIHKLYDSYILIKGKFCDAEDNCIFENELERVEFVVYTSAEVNFTNIAISTLNKNELIVTNNGPIFQFDYKSLFDKSQKKSRDPKKKFFENEEESQEFLSKYYLYSYQAKESKVEEILKEELRQYYKTSDIDLLFLKLHNEIQNWWMLQNVAPYLTETCQLFSEIIQEVKHDSFLSTLKQLYVNNNNEIKINFEFNEDAVTSLDLSLFLETVEHILIIKTLCTKLTMKKVWQYFQHKGADNCIFIDLSHATKNNLCEKVKHEFQKTLNDVWIIQCSHVDEINKIYIDIEQAIRVMNKKIIFVTSNDFDEFCFNIPSKKCNDEKICLSHLTEESQIKILRETVGVFQGEDMKFSEIVNEEWKHTIDGKILSKLISKEKLHIGREVTDFRYDIVKATYIDQELLCSVEINNTFIKNNGEVNATKFREFLVVYDTEWVDINVSGGQEILLISNRNIKFTEICEKYPKQCIHLFKKYNNTFIWVKTQGNLKNIRNYVVHNPESNNSVVPNTVKDIESKIIIVAAEPGMGKSTLLNYLSNETKKIRHALKEKNLWIVRINLLDYDLELNDLKTKNISGVEAMEFLRKAAISKNNDLDIMNLEKKIFNCFYKSGNVVLQFDGFDEICPNYKQIVIKLLVIFKNDINIKKLWITTRPYNIQNEIEDELGSFAYTIVPFSKEKQKNFLNILLENEKNCILKSDELVLLFYKSVDDKNESFFSIPLNMYMIVTLLTQQKHGDKNKVADERQVSSEIIYTLSKCYSRKRRIASYYSRNSISDVNKNRKINSYKLYNMFLEYKFHEIRLTEKTLISKEHNKNPDMEKTIEREYKYTIDTHKMLAMKTMFPEELTKLKILSIKEMRELNNQIKTIKEGGERTGIVYRIVNNIPQFLHITFVEYFVVEFICDFIVNSSSESLKRILNFFINDVLIKDNYKNIREFFDSKLGTGFCFRTEDEENEYDAIELLLFELLLGQEVQKTPSLITIAIKEELINIVEFSLHVIEGNLKKSNLNSFVQLINDHALLYLAYSYQHVNFIATILKLVANVIEGYSIPQFSNDVCIFVQFMAEAIGYGCDDVKVLLDVMYNKGFIKEILDTVITYPNIIHRVTEVNKFSILSPYLENLAPEQLNELLKMSNNTGHTPAHNAASWNDFNFFYNIRDLLKNRRHFREICLARNKITLTPMDYFKVSSFENTQENEYMQLLCDLCPYDIEMTNSTDLNNENFEDICKFIAKNYKLFQSLSEDENKYVFFNKALEYLKYLYANDESCNNRMLAFALENDNKIIVDTLLADMDNTRLIEIITKIHKDARPLIGISTPRIHSKILLGRLKKLNKNQLMQIINVTDDRGCTPVHYAAMDESHEFFDFLMGVLQEEDFKRICLTRCDSFFKFTPLDIWFGSNQAKHLYKVINVFQNESEVDVNHDSNNQSLDESNNEHDSAADSKVNYDSKSDSDSESETDSKSESDSIIGSDSDSDYEIEKLGSNFKKLWNYFCPSDEINE